MAKKGKRVEAAEIKLQKKSQEKQKLQEKQLRQLQKKHFHAKLEILGEAERKKARTKRHMGIRGLLEYTALLAIIGLGYIIYNLINPNIITKTTPFLQPLEILFVVSIIFILYGMFERKHWVWVLSIAWFFAVMIYSLFLHYKMLTLSLVPFELFLMLSLFSLIMNSTIIWYIYLKKLYFTNIYYTDKFTLTDKIFVNIVVSLLVMLLAISITIFRIS